MSAWLHGGVCVGVGVCGRGGGSGHQLVPVVLNESILPILEIVEHVKHEFFLSSESPPLKPTHVHTHTHMHTQFISVSSGILCSVYIMHLHKSFRISFN